METDSRNDRREELPGFGKIASVLYLLSYLLSGKASSRNHRAGGAQGFGKIGPLVPLFVSLLAGKADSRNDRRPEPWVSRRSSPFFSVFFPVLRKAGSQNHKREDWDFATIWTVFPAAEDCATAPTMGENRGSPRRPSSSQRYTVDNPTPAHLAAVSRDPPRQSSVTTARAAGVVNFDGRPPGLRRTAMIEPPNLRPNCFFHRFKRPAEDLG